MEANFPQLCQNEPLNSPFELQIRCTECLSFFYMIINNTFANLIFVSFIARSGFSETPILLGFGKSYLIPFTSKFDIGEGIELMNEVSNMKALGIKKLETHPDS